MRVKPLRETTIFLDQGEQAAATENWSEVIYCLQQLPILLSKTPFEQRDPEIKRQTIQLALSVLINGDFQQKWHIAKLFVPMGNDAIVPLISLMKQDKDHEVKWFAASILGNFKEQQVIVALAELLQNSSDSDLIAIAAKSLSQIGTPAIDTLIALLDKPDYRLVAAKSLAHIRLLPVFPALLGLVADQNAEIRVLAIEALGSFRHPQVPPILIQALKDTNSMVRKEAVIALGFCNHLWETLELASHLEPLLYDLNLDVSCQAATSLGKMSHDLANEALNQALISPYTSLKLKLNIVKALAWSEISSGLDYLHKAFSLGNEIITQEIITLLGRITAIELKPQAIAIIQNFWSSSSDNINVESKKALAMALGELQATNARDILQQLAADPSKMVQLYAIASSKKLALKNDE